MVEVEMEIEDETKGEGKTEAKNIVVYFRLKVGV